MNPQRLRPLGLGDIFDEGFDLYKRNFVFLLLVTAAAVVPLDILLAFVRPSLMAQVYQLFDVTGSQSDAFGLWLINVAVKLTVDLPLYALVLSPLVVAASGCYLQQNPSLWGGVQPVLRRLPGLALCLLIGAFFLDLGLVACVVCWAIPATLLIFAPQAFLLERRGPGKALSRSSALVNGYGGRVFGCLLALGAVLWVIGLGIKLPLVYLFETAFSIGPKALSGAAMGASGDAQAQVVILLSTGLTHLLLFPFLVSVLTVLYYDMRIRKEGYDIDLLAETLGYPPLNQLGPFLPPAPVFQPFRPGYMPPPLKAGRKGPH